MDTTSLSVIIPVYNTGDKLRRCLDSVLNQSFTAWELILVDDGSEASTADLCDYYAAKDTRIQVLHTVNNGVSAARNKGLAQARGEWVCFIDSDDWIEQDYLKNFISRIGTGAEMIMQGYVKEKGETEIWRKHLTDAFVVREEIPGYFLDNNLIDFGSPCCKLFRQRILHEYGLSFPESYSYGEDTLFFFNYIQYCRTISCIGREGYHYVENSAESLSQRVHHSLPLLRFIKDNTEAMSAWPATKIWDEIRLRQNAKNVALANRAYINMFKLGYSQTEGMAIIRYFQERVRPQLRHRCISAHDRGFLAITILPVKLQWLVLIALRAVGIIKA